MTDIDDWPTTISGTIMMTLCLVKSRAYFIINSITNFAEYLKIVRAVGVGFVMMGVVGYAVKLLHIPIRYLIV